MLMYNSKIAYLVCIFLLLGCNRTITHSYQEFLDEETTNPGFYKSELAKQLKYPPVYRENKIEGPAHFLLKHHKSNEVELELVSHKFDSVLSSNFAKPISGEIAFKNVRNTIKKINAIYLKGSEKDYQAKFSILFDMEPYENDTTVYDKYDFVVLGEEVDIKIEHKQ